MYLSSPLLLLKFYLLTCYLLHAGFLFDLFFDSEDGGETFLRKVG
jgi:hypothetical protein